jgi:penicillin V acylase-like amidase (Ntn superfamily)
MIDNSVTEIPNQWQMGFMERLLWNDNPIARVMGRNMDWFEDMYSEICLFSQGAVRSSGVTNPQSKCKVLRFGGQ